MKEEDIDSRLYMCFFLNNFEHVDFHILPSFKFMRKGQVGSYKEELPKEFIEKIDNWENSYLEKFDLTLNDILYSQ